MPLDSAFTAPYHCGVWQNIRATIWAFGPVRPIAWHRPLSGRRLFRQEKCPKNNKQPAPTGVSGLQKQPGALPNNPSLQEAGPKRNNLCGLAERLALSVRGQLLMYKLNFTQWPP